ncbi:trypsin-like peptidase domain-containing protein [Streptomyces sp. NA02950]|uniref:S1 family peptidase n=1 Tax=Streptomyces sp. NA02950 TaxID=2742137 RepID=UPI001590C70C|nr:serine protease [Streptomyces sp. NA02950]QKV93898.1 trypsin-like peptidase domain-containing protein [Streptomyces sp. NA02950]
MPNGTGSQLDFFSRFAPCLVCVESRGIDGELGVGTAFHIGDGCLVTARHVIEGRELVSLTPYESSAEISLESVEVIYPSDETVDIALLRTDFSLDLYMKSNIILTNGSVNNKVDHIEIGGHLDDWINNSLVLMEVIVMGYPPIPTSPEPVLVATRGEVNAIIDPYVGSNHPLFVLSPMARGGFSGGPALTGNGFLLGIITSSLLTNYAAPELGYGVALTVEPLWNLLLENNIYPGSENRQMMGALFDLPDNLPAPIRRPYSPKPDHFGEGCTSEPPF